MSNGMTYGHVVNYDLLDPFKRECQFAAQSTMNNVRRLGFKILPESYGESAFLFESIDNEPYIMAHVEEGLGTKNLVAEAMFRLTGNSHYDHIGVDNVAMAVNDLLTLGAFPISYALHVASGGDDWFLNKQYSPLLIRGTQRGCDLAGCAWGGGETPTLKGIVNLGTIVLSGSAVGVIKPKKWRVNPARIQHGDAIILLESSGIHANGLSMARKIADKLPNGYLTRLPNDRTFGETLLDPTYIYVQFIERCLRHGIDIHYLVNITGHGWRKLMRADLQQGYTYVISRLPRPRPIFDFMREHGPIETREAYATFNMGAGFAMYIPSDQITMVMECCQLHPLHASLSVVHAGHIERSQEKKVEIVPVGLTFTEKELAVR